MLLNLTTSAMGTAVGLVSDLTTGAIDRFRTLPIWRSAVLVGRSVADLLSAALCISIVAVTGLAIGWRPTTGPASILAGFAIALFFSYALSWACACLGIVSKGPESAQGIGLIILFPLAIVSNAMVPTANMPDLAEDHRGLESRECGHLGGANAVRQPEPLPVALRLAHATPGGRGPDLVGRHSPGLRAAGCPPVPSPHYRLRSLSRSRTTGPGRPGPVRGPSLRFRRGCPRRTAGSCPSGPGQCW